MRMTLALVLIFSVGCGSSTYETGVVASAKAPADAAEYAGDYAGEEAGEGPSGSDAALDAAASRKIVYTARVDLTVADVEAFVAEVRDLTRAAGGFVGDSSVTGRKGSNRSASVTVRVPSAEYGDFLAAVSVLGDVDSRSESAADVTEQYVDLEARIKNKLREEARLVELLEDKTGKLPDILAVEKELSRVREEVERFQGRMNVLKDQVALSTVTLTARERRTYEPPKPTTLGERLAAVWDNSVRRVGEFFARLVVEFVAFVPWLVVWIPLGLIGWLVVRRVMRKKS